MFNFLRRLFVVKEIRSKKGELHFVRYRVLSSPFFSIYIHYIAKSDEDLHPHSHPWDYTSIILAGGYEEELWDYKNCEYYDFRPLNSQNTCGTCRIKWKPISKIYKRFSIVNGCHYNYHKLTLLKPTWSLVFTGSRKKHGGSDWGYLVDNEHVEHEKYRKNKNNA